MGASLPRSRETAAVAIAVLLHAGLLSAPLALPTERAQIARSSGAADRTWFDLEWVEAPRSASDAPRPAGAIAARAAPRSEDLPRARAALPAAPAHSEPPPIAAAPAPVALAIQGEPAGEAPSEATEAAPSGGAGATPIVPLGPGPDEYGPVESGPAIAPGLDGTAIWALPGVLAPAPRAAPAPTAAPAPAPVDEAIAGKVLAATLKARDKDLGIQAPAAGVVASTIAGAVRGSAAPTDGRATFEVRVDGGGNVTGVRVVSATGGDTKTWERVSKDATAALSSRALSLGEAAKDGATVVVKVASKVVYPAGSKKKVDVEPVCAEEVIEDMAAALEEVGSGEKKPSAAAIRGDRKFCIPIGVRGKGDASNIGAKAQLQVTSSYEIRLPGERKLPAEQALPVDTRAPWLKELPSPARGPRLPRKKWKPKKKKKKPPR